MIISKIVYRYTRTYHKHRIELFRIKINPTILNKMFHLVIIFKIKIKLFGNPIMGKISVTIANYPQLMRFRMFIMRFVKGIQCLFVNIVQNVSLYKSISEYPYPYKIIHEPNCEMKDITE